MALRVRQGSVAIAKLERRIINETCISIVKKLYPRTFQRLILAGFMLAPVPLVLAIGYAVFTLQGLAAQSEQAVKNASGAARASRQLAESLIGMERVLRQYIVVREKDLADDYRRLRADFRQVASELAGTPLDSASGSRVPELLAREQSIAAADRGARCARSFLGQPDRRISRH